MTDETIIGIITSNVSPAGMIAGNALLILAFFSRQVSLNAHLRELHKEALHHAELYKETKAKYQAERAALCMRQAKAIYSRASLIRWTLGFQMISIASWVAAIAALGVAAFYRGALGASVGCFFTGIISLFISAVFAVVSTLRVLKPIEHEHADTEKLLARIANIPVGGLEE